MAPEIQIPHSHEYEDHTKPECIAEKSITKLLLDLSDDTRCIEVVPRDQHIGPWVKPDPEIAEQVPAVRKKRPRKRKPDSVPAGSSDVMFCNRREEGGYVSYPTCHMSCYISRKTRSKFTKPDNKIPPLNLYRPEYRLSSREEARYHSLNPDKTGDQRSILSTQAPCLLNRSCLAWSGANSTAEQLPRLQRRSETKEPEVVMLLRPGRDYYTTGQVTRDNQHITRDNQHITRDYHYNTRDNMEMTVANRNSECVSRETTSTNRNTDYLPRDPDLGYTRILPFVRNCRVTWRASPEKRTELTSISPTSSDYRSDLLTRTSSASSRASSINIGVHQEFKGKLQNFLHKSSEGCFKKLPCGLVYGKSLKGSKLRRGTRSCAVELCVRPV